MTLRDISFKPGILTEASDREVGKIGFWKDCNFVRFFNGLPERMGGYVKDNPLSSVLGIARGSVDWRSLRDELIIGMGTHLKLYVWIGGTFSDITPYRETGTLGADPFATTNASATVTVTDAAHGLAVGDYVHFSGATAVAGITISGQYVVVTVPGSGSYTITHSANANATTTGGGASVAYSYELGVGEETSVKALGFGVGTWGGSTWGTPRATSTIVTYARTWSCAAWGEDLLASPRGGKLYVWDSSVGTGTRATLITQAPSTMQAMFVSQEDRHVVALGAHDGSVSDPMLIRWCDTEDYTDWTILTTNTAGSKRLDQGNMILCGVAARGERLIFTDSHLFSMLFSGPPDTFSFRSLGGNGGIMGPLAAVEAQGVVYWMGLENFYAYDGAIHVLPCTIHSHVFRDINLVQQVKVCCGANRSNNEIWWLYPTADSDEVDAYAVYNTLEKTWYYGTLARTLYVGDSDIIAPPYAMGTDGFLYYHDVGASADGGAISAFLESGDFELDEAGNQIMHVSKYIPDFARLSGSVSVTFTGKKYPQATETQASGPHTITATTQFVNPRMRARQVSVKIESSGTGDDWRMGGVRVDQTPHGGR